MVFRVTQPHDFEEMPEIKEETGKLEVNQDSEKKRANIERFKKLLEEQKKNK